MTDSEDTTQPPTSWRICYRCQRPAPADCDHCIHCGAAPYPGRLVGGGPLRELVVYLVLLAMFFLALRILAFGVATPVIIAVAVLLILTIVIVGYVVRRW